MDAAGAWSRRRFLGATADAAVLATLAGALKPLASLAGQGEGTTTLYDPRFPAARPLALELAGAGRLCVAGGDPTALLQHWVDGTSGDTRPRLQGVTTESLPFCLRQLAPRARLTQRRIDRDLFVWTFEART
jgi:hypothetical protein